MITKYKREDLEDLIQDSNELYYVQSLVGDKLRSIYVLFGWTHMLADLRQTDDLIETLTQDVLEALLSDDEKVLFASAGLEVAGYWDEEDYLNLDYSFKLL